MRTLIGSRRGRLKFHKTYVCASAEGSGVVTLFQAWLQQKDQLTETVRWFVGGLLAPLRLVVYLPVLGFEADLPLILGRRPNGFLGLSLNDMTIIFLVILLEKTVSVG